MKYCYLKLSYFNYYISIKCQGCWSDKQLFIIVSSSDSILKEQVPSLTSSFIFIFQNQNCECFLFSFLYSSFPSPCNDYITDFSPEYGCTGLFSFLTPPLSIGRGRGTRNHCLTNTRETFP